MPEICRFYGIVIKMFFDEHPPPHFHAEYGEHKGILSIFYGNTWSAVPLCTANCAIHEAIALLTFIY